MRRSFCIGWSSPLLFSRLRNKITFSSCFELAQIGIVITCLQNFFSAYLIIASFTNMFYSYLGFLHLDKLYPDRPHITNTHPREEACRRSHTPDPRFWSCCLRNGYRLCIQLALAFWIQSWCYPLSSLQIFSRFLVVIVPVAQQRHLMKSSPLGFKNNLALRRWWLDIAL